MKADVMQVAHGSVARRFLRAVVCTLLMSLKCVLGQEDKVPNISCSDAWMLETVRLIDESMTPGRQRIAALLAEMLVELRPSDYRGHLCLSVLARVEGHGKIATYRLEKARSLAGEIAKSELDQLEERWGQALATDVNGANANKRKMDFAVLTSIRKDLAAASERPQKDVLLREFLDRSSSLLVRYPDERSLYFGRAEAALELDDPEVGRRIAAELLMTSLVKSATDAELEILARFERKGWNATESAQAFEVIRADADPSVVKDQASREAIAAAGLPWSVKHRKTGVVMLLIPAGESVVGSPETEWGRAVDEARSRFVLDKAIYVAETEVSQSQWSRLLKNPSKFVEDQLPVESVSYDTVAAWLTAAGDGLRLPSESEWEYACRAKSDSPFHFGSAIDSGVCNYNAEFIYKGGSAGVFRKKTTRVGSFVANAFGLKDMHGNVWEWCDGSVGSLVGKGPGAEAAQMPIRGGGWSDFPSRCRSAQRLLRARDHEANTIGFRPVCDAARVKSGL